MTKQAAIAMMLALSVGLPNLALADFQLTDKIRVNGFFQNRTAFNLKDDPYIGEAASVLDIASDHRAGDVLRFENAARLFFIWLPRSGDCESIPGFSDPKG